MSQGLLSEDLLKQIGAYTAGMQKNVSLILNTGDHEERDNLKKFLGAVASCSDRLSVEERDLSNILRSPVSLVWRLRVTSREYLFLVFPVVMNLILLY